MKIGFLHTARIHISTFTKLMKSFAPELDSVHRVDEDVLRQATRYGLTAPVCRAVEEDFLQLRSQGATLLVCTCSTLGAVAESLTIDGGRTLRIDRPMADAAVGYRRLLVLAALESTLGPTAELLDSSARSSARASQYTLRVVEGAWRHFQAGDPHSYLHTIAEAVQAQAHGYDAVVLAQASMAAAAPLCRVEVPVLSSPEMGVRHLVRLASSS